MEARLEIRLTVPYFSSVGGASKEDHDFLEKIYQLVRSNPQGVSLSKILLCDPVIRRIGTFRVERTEHGEAFISFEAYAELDEPVTTTQIP